MDFRIIQKRRSSCCHAVKSCKVSSGLCKVSSGSCKIPTAVRDAAQTLAMVPARAMVPNLSGCCPNARDGAEPCRMLSGRVQDAARMCAGWCPDARAMLPRHAQDAAKPCAKCCWGMRTTLPRCGARKTGRCAKDRTTRETRSHSKEPAAVQRGRGSPKPARRGQVQTL